MKYGWLDSYCLSKKGAEKDYKPEWEATRYMIGGRMFAMVGGDRQGKPIVSLKLEPMHGEILRREYEDVIPGYYLNKVHWSSVYLDGQVPDNVLKAMLDESYRLVLEGLGKKAKEEILTR
ncbi:MAG: MmcQ/YjbR family DNA-binding protein [Firmicutes bacterium]|nr:MmcQ/YjbR family DNA-binding protein [Bacillota bacterium]